MTGDHGQSFAPAAPDKRAARAAARAAVLLLTPTQRALAGARVCQRLMALPVFAQARVLMLFAPLSDEIDLTPVLERCGAEGRSACIPRMDWAARTMEPVPVRSWEELVPSRHGLREPPPERPAVAPDTLDLVIVPGAAFDRGGHRLGRGGGFYDRFLARAELRRAFLLGVGFASQLVDRVPREHHDRPVDAVVTDGEIIVGGRAGPP